MAEKKIAGEIITIDDTPVAIVGDTFADLLDINNWTEIENGKVVNPGTGPTKIIVGRRRPPEKDEPENDSPSTPR